MIYLFSLSSKKGVKHIKIIDTKFLRPDNLNDFDTIIFTSKTSVRALEFFNIKWKHCLCFAIGEHTAREILKRGGKVEFVSKNSYGDEFAREIKPLLYGKKILFPRAKKTVSNIKEILKPIEIDEQILYETVCAENGFEKPPKHSTLIFTSPSSILCFLKKFDFDKSYKVICIGKKTASFLPKDITCNVPDIQNIDECIKLAKIS